MASDGIGTFPVSAVAAHIIKRKPMLIPKNIANIEDISSTKPTRYAIGGVLVERDKKGTARAVHNGIINRAALRTLILRQCKELRTGWPCVRVSEDVLEAYEHALLRRVIEDVKSHPTRGKTFMDGGYRDLPNSDTQKDEAVIRKLRAKIRRMNT